MKKMMMAIAAAMMMTMSGNAMAAETTTPAPETHDATSANMTATGNSIRVMVHMNGKITNKFEYALDNEGRVTSKTMFRYIRETNTWMPVMQYSATYGDDTNILSFAAYDKSNGTFTNHKVETAYSSEECPVLIALPECINY